MKVWSKGRGLTEVCIAFPCVVRVIILTIVKVDWDSTEFCYAPIIQSRGTSSGYDLRPNTEPSADNMAHKGVLLVSVGMRYRGYCANVGRSFIVDPTKVCAIKSSRAYRLTLALKEQESVYALLVALQQELLSKMKHGAVARDVYNHAISFIKERKPELEKHFVKNIGFGVRCAS